MDIDRLSAFIISAKAATYVGDGAVTEPLRPGSHDLEYKDGPFMYHDSYFGGTDFIGEEVVYQNDNPVWAMNYYGYILKPEAITAAEAGAMIKASLSKLYAEGRFLGGWDHRQDELVYHDRPEGDLIHFTGREWIEKSGVIVYELLYHGGLIKD
ncbi:hypothetical protein KQH50_01290 [bacterium]|nr:hypothetical protein [bacterium]